MVVFVSVRDYAADSTVDAVCVGDRAVVGVVVDAVAIVAAVEVGTGVWGMGGIRNFTVRARTVQ